MQNNYYAVVMAGGGGTRLWPLSRQSRPKQMLKLVDERTLFQAAVARLDGLFTPEHIFVVTVEEQAEELQAQAPEIPPENYLLEPMPRGTASVVGFAAIAIHNRDPQASMAVVTADHIIKNEEKYRQLLLSAYQTAQDGYLVTLGILPTYAATGYGYIQQGDLVGNYQDLNVYRALRFREKPSIEQAREMLESSDHAWNSGMFVWRVDRIMAEFSRQMPDLYSKLMEISNAWDQPQIQEVIGTVWPRIKSQTIDFGIMENAENVAVIPAQGLGWSDVGTWDALFDVLPADENGNIVMGGMHVPIDTQDTLIYTNQEHRLIVTIGVEDLVIVDTGDVVLVCHKNQVQEVRQVVDQLKQKHYGDFV
jgi:mannose-1-phosphate guanylyltransferase